MKQTLSLLFIGVVVQLLPTDCQYTVVNVQLLNAIYSKGVEVEQIKLWPCFTFIYLAESGPEPSLLQTH